MRDEAGLQRALTRIGAIREVLPEIDVRPSEEGWSDLAQVLDLRAGLTPGEATVRGALARTESRGCHNRSDFPEIDDNLRVNFITAIGDDGRLREPWPEPVPPVSDELEKFLATQGDFSLKGRLLE